MTARLPYHPVRQAETLAVLDRAACENGPFAPPGPGSADCRVDQKLLIARVRHALATRGTEVAHARLAALDIPDLWAGTVRDGAARGFSVALEEALSLCEPPGSSRDPDDTPDVLEGKELRRRREFVLKTGGARVRFSRKLGVCLVDRETDLSEQDCIRFEDRSDDGDLDGFVPRDAERPRLFSPAFLQARRWIEGREWTRLELVGRLGRRFDGFPCELTFEGHANERAVRMRVRVKNDRHDHRLRIRFLGVDDAVHHRGTPGWERVHVRGRTFLAATIVRANGSLRVNEEIVSVPNAQCVGWTEHEFLLGRLDDARESGNEGWFRALDSAH